MRGVWIGALVGTVALAGCSVRVNKGGGGEDKDVSVNMPGAHVQVHKNTRGAADVGLPTYPGAQLTTDDGDDDKAVDVNLGFGPWKMRVGVANYATTDPESKVQAFYEKALAQYGAVLRCRGDEPVGGPERTGEGLTCKSDGGSGHVHTYASDADLQLKAGSPRKQHIVAFDQKKGGTHFALIALDLPAESGNAKGSNEE